MGRLNSRFDNINVSHSSDNALERRLRSQEATIADLQRANENSNLALERVTQDVEELKALLLDATKKLDVSNKRAQALEKACKFMNGEVGLLKDAVSGVSSNIFFQRVST